HCGSTLKRYWNVQHVMYSIIHLKDSGTVNISNQQRIGERAKAVRSAEAAHKSTIRGALEGGVCYMNLKPSYNATVILVSMWAIESKLINTRKLKIYMHHISS